MPVNIAIFASGSGSNAENIIRVLRTNPAFRFPLIVSNKSDAQVHRRAENLNVKSVTLPREAFADGEKVLETLKEHGIDGIVLAGFLLKMPASIIEKYPNKIINIHPALLPKYGGKGMYGARVHQAVKDAGETKSGITIHYVNENYDEGNIIFQAACAVAPNDTPDDIAEKVHALEYKHFPRVVEEVFEK